jgi:hypothetical protein
VFGCDRFESLNLHRVQTSELDAEAGSIFESVKFLCGEGLALASAIGQPLKRVIAKFVCHSSISFVDFVYALPCFI